MNIKLIIFLAIWTILPITTSASNNSKQHSDIVAAFNSIGATYIIKSDESGSYVTLINYKETAEDACKYLQSKNINVRSVTNYIIDMKNTEKYTENVHFC